MNQLPEKRFEKAMPVKQTSLKPTSQPKETALKAIRHLKDTASYEDMMYELYVLQKIEHGRAEVRRGNVVSHEEAKARLSKWLK